MISGVGVGVHSLTVTDSNDCRVSLQSTVDGPAEIQANIAFDAPKCNGDVADLQLTATGGWGDGFVYQWSNGASIEDLTGANAVGGGGGLSGGSTEYTVTVKDARYPSCYKTASALVVNPPKLVPTLDDIVLLCHGDLTTLDLGVSGGQPGYTYAWDTGATTQDLANVGLDADESEHTFSVTVTDSTGVCTAAASATVTQPAKLEVSLDYTCGSGFAVNVQGGTGQYSYSWGSVATSGASSDVTVTVTDENGCASCHE
jgi:hypothetical protein